MQNQPVSTLWTNDIDAMTTQFGGQSLMAIQLSPGTFEGQLLQVQFDHIQCWQLSWNQKVQLLGMLPPETVALWIPLSNHHYSLWKGFECHHYQVILHLEDGLDYTHLASGYFACITTNQRYFSQLINRDQSEKLAKTELVQGILIPSSEHLQALSHHLEEIFALAIANPELLLQPPLNQVMIKKLVSCLMELILSSRQALESNKRSLKRILRLKRSADYIRANLHQPLSIQSIAAEIGIGPRSLIYNFRNFFGMGPMEYCKSNRLNAVRRCLKTADAKTDRVIEIARSWGFYHMGHFSADYKAMFGELPSETLQRSS